MDSLRHLFHILLTHDDAQLRGYFAMYGTWSYVVLFVIVFCETGLVVAPFLPGDTLLLLAGSIAHIGGLDPIIVSLVLITAALCGDNVNYIIGCKLGRRLFHNEKSKIFNKRSLDRTHAFFEKYGGRTVIVARFLPVFRTFTPFVAGMAKMSYRLFLMYSVVAAILWVSLFVSIGYFASKWARDNMMWVLGAIILVSAVPGVWEFYRHYKDAKSEKAAGEPMSEHRVEVVDDTEPSPESVDLSKT